VLFFKLELLQLESIIVLLLLLLQKHAKFVESGLKAVKARNEYILCLEAANAAVQKYFSDDIHDLINVRLLHLLHYLFVVHF